MLRFQPKEGSVIYCDYSGFIEPEMIKNRPAIVIHKHRYNSRLLLIVPISTTEPKPILSHHIEIEQAFCQINLNGLRSWVKCDMVNTVSLDRLNLVRDKSSGLRHAPNIGHAFLLKIKEAVKKSHNL